MSEMPVNEGQDQVAAGLENETGANATVDESTVNNENIETGSGIVGQDGKKTPDEVRKQSAEADKAFAQMRKDKEQAQREARQAQEQMEAQIQAKRDKMYADRFGKDLGIFTEAQYWQAMDRQREQLEAKRQQDLVQIPQQIYDRAIAEGYDPKVAELMRNDAIKDLKLQQMEQRLAEADRFEKQRQEEAQNNKKTEAATQRILADHQALKNKYGDLVPDLADIDEETKNLMKSDNMPLRAAWLTVHEDEIIEAKRNAEKAKTLKNVNSKSHLQSEKPGAGDFGTEVNLSAEQLRVWKAMGYNEKEARKRAAKYPQKRG
jgi:hypothetical protein